MSVNEAAAHLRTRPGHIEAVRGESPGGHRGWWVTTPQGQRFVSDLELDRQGIDVTALASPPQPR